MHGICFSAVTTLEILLAQFDAFYSSEVTPTLHRGNPLIEALPPINTDIEILRKLTNLPDTDRNVSMQMPPHVRSFEIDFVRQIYVPPPMAAEYARNIDYMIRQSYVDRNPFDSKHQKHLYGVQDCAKNQNAHHETNALMMTLKGLSGMGKSRLTKAVLEMYPQVIYHTQYRDKCYPAAQIVWLSVEAPIAGSIKGFLLSLFTAIDRALGYENTLKSYSMQAKTKTNIDNMVSSFVQIAATHSLGILHIDDIQRIKETSTDREYVIQTIIRLANVSKFAVLFSGTDDITKVIQKMLSEKTASKKSFHQQFEITRRMVTGGYFKLERAKDFKDKFFSKLVSTILKYQWLENPLIPTEITTKFLHEISAGLPSVLLLLHRLAQREALLNAETSLHHRHYTMAYKKHLRPLVPLLKVLREGKFDDTDFDIDGKFVALFSKVNFA